MEPVDPPVAGHPLVAVLDRVEAGLDDGAGLPVWSLDAKATGRAIEQVTRLESKLVATKLALLAHGDVVDVSGPSGGPNTASWLAVTTRTDAFAQTKLAASLETDRHSCVRAGLADGRLRVDQAKVIVAAIDLLCTESEGLPGVDADVVARAEVWLVEQAAFYDAKTLKVLSRRLLEVVAPDLADAYEAKRLESEEARAAAHTRLTMSDDGHGSVFVKAKLPSLHGAMLKKILLAYAAPKHQAAAAAQDGVPTPARQPSPERMGQAFCSLLESLTSDDLPEAGGTGATGHPACATSTTTPPGPTAESPTSSTPGCCAPTTTPEPTTPPTTPPSCPAARSPSTGAPEPARTRVLRCCACGDAG